MDLKFVGILLLFAAAVYTAHVEEDNEEDPEEALYGDFDEEDEVDQENISELAKDARRKGRWDHFFSVRGRYCSCNLPAALGDEPEEGRDAVKKAAAKRKFIAYLSKLIRPYFKAVSLKCHCTANHRVVRLLKYLHTAKVAAHKAKVQFSRRLHALIKSVKMQ